MKNMDLMSLTTVKKDPELPLLQRISSLELPVSEIAAQINASQSGGHHQSQVYHTA